MNDNKARAPADTVGGKILIGVAIAAISGILGVVGGWIVARNAPPVAKLVPTSLTAPTDEVVQFSASASSDPEGDPLTYVWTVGGTALEESPVARCNAKGDLAECRFMSPGTYGVNVKVSDKSGLSDVAAAYVSVEIKGGYIGLRVATSGQKSDELYRALLAAVDWAVVQAHSPRLLIFYDPDRRRAVYAASIKPDKKVDVSVLAGTKVLVPFPPGPALEAVKAGLEKAGARVVSMPADQVILALRSGAGEVGFVSLSKPSPGSICPDC